MKTTEEFSVIGLSNALLNFPGDVELMKLAFILWF